MRRGDRAQFETGPGMDGVLPYRTWNSTPRRSRLWFPAWRIRRVPAHYRCRNLPLADYKQSNIAGGTGARSALVNGLESETRNVLPMNCRIHLAVCGNGPAAGRLRDRLDRLRPSGQHEG